MKPISQWPKDISNRDPKAVLRYSEELKDEIETHCYIQYLFYKQYFSLKEYANKHGVKLLGDIPIYVPEDSADFFAEREQFQTDSDGRPSAVSGVPPDYFSESGQLWGTPLYNWQFQKADGYRWWQKRLGHQLSMFDALRIDHFRGFADYWSIPYGSEDARGGHWEKGPGADFFDELSQRFCNPQIIAEDLGIIDDDVVELLRHTGYPGMKVLQFAFDGSASPYLPQNYDENCVVYTGTHDNDTTAGFFEGEGDTPKLAESYLSDFDGSMIRRLIVCALRSKASLAVIPMQDWLELGSDARMNTPSTVNGNWSWRLKENELSDSLAKELADLSENSKRS